MKAQLDLNSQVIDSGTREQATVSKQIAQHGRAIAQLRLDKAKQPTCDDAHTNEPLFPEHHTTSTFTHNKSRATGTSSPHNFQFGTRDFSSYDTHKQSSPIPKMPFPKFVGTNPHIWIDKAVNYFTIYNIPKCLWVTASIVAFDENASKWLQVYKIQHGLGTWEEFTMAATKQFGTYDYKHAMNDLMKLKQSRSVHKYHQEFTNAKYQLHMHNTALDDTFFVQQFVSNLKTELRGSVQS